MPRTLRGIELRYTLTRLLVISGQMTVTDLCAALERWGFDVAGRPTKTVSDALRWEMRRGRAVRVGHGLYGAGYSPRGTDARITARVQALREEAESLRVAQRRAHRDPNGFAAGDKLGP